MQLRWLMTLSVIHKNLHNYINITDKPSTTIKKNGKYCGIAFLCAKNWIEANKLLTISKFKNKQNKYLGKIESNH